MVDSTNRRKSPPDFCEARALNGLTAGLEELLYSSVEVIFRLVFVRQTLVATSVYLSKIGYITGSLLTSRRRPSRNLAKLGDSFDSTFKLGPIIRAHSCLILPACVQSIGCFSDG